MSEEKQSGSVQQPAAEAGTEQAPGKAAPGKGEAPETTASAEDLVKALEKARAEAEESRNAMLRARADLENLRKRSAREAENARKYALERFVAELLPVKDSMELGLAAAEQTEDVAKLREGMALTLKMLGAALEKFGVSPVDPQGEKFNPDLHQAMSMQETDQAEPGTVLDVVQRGYLLNDRLVRPAMVTVARKTVKTEA